MAQTAYEKLPNAGDYEIMDLKITAAETIALAHMFLKDTEEEINIVTRVFNEVINKPTFPGPWNLARSLFSRKAQVLAKLGKNEELDQHLNSNVLKDPKENNALWHEIYKCDSKYNKINDLPKKIIRLKEIQNQENVTPALKTYLKAQLSTFENPLVLKNIMKGLKNKMKNPELNEKQKNELISAYNAIEKMVSQ